jgi:hypothetical protein
VSPGAPRCAAASKGDTTRFTGDRLPSGKVKQSLVLLGLIPAASTRRRAPPAAAAAAAPDTPGRHLPAVVASLGRP